MLGVIPGLRAPAPALELRCQAELTVSDHYQHSQHCPAPPSVPYRGSKCDDHHHKVIHHQFVLKLRLCEFFQNQAHGARCSLVTLAICKYRFDLSCKRYSQFHDFIHHLLSQFECFTYFWGSDPMVCVKLF